MWFTAFAQLGWRRETWEEMGAAAILEQDPGDYASSSDDDDDDDDDGSFGSEYDDDGSVAASESDGGQSP